ncbi:MAG: DegQ family serine endoprotease [Verrucomicrobiota bacterium]|jgi:serine protease Do
MKRYSILGLTALSPGLGILALGLTLQLSPSLPAAEGASKKAPNPPARLNLDETPLPRDIKAGSSFAPVVKKVAPSVVNIYSTTTVRERAIPNPFLNDPFWGRFFGEHFGLPSQPRSYREQSLGSGVIVSTDGYILTASHVVAGADSVKVALATGEKAFDAKVIGTDPPTDIAVLKIEARSPLHPITIADSDKLEVGDMVLAVGNPFAVGQTVTLGIISALERGGLGISGYENFIQTDAAINPGNSGGALVDAQGRLVGINAAIATRTGGYQGVGFAVPINLARFAMDNLIREGKVTRGYLGINPQTLTPDLARIFDLPEDTAGVLVGGVIPNSPAEKAGLQGGDVITEINGKKMADRRNLQLLIAQTPPGTKTSLRLWRGQPGHKPAEQTLTAKLGELPAEALASAGGGERTTPKPRSQSNLDALEGVEVTDLDARSRRQFDIPANIRGALVLNVQQDSNAAEAGLRPGDVILEIDRRPVTNADAAVEMSEQAKGDQILLRVWSLPSGGGPAATRYLVVDNIKHK